LYSVYKVQRETFKFNPQHSDYVQDVRQRRIVPFWSSYDTPAFITLECLATSMRWLKTISKLIKNSLADSTPEN